MSILFTVAQQDTHTFLLYPCAQQLLGAMAVMTELSSVDQCFVPCLCSVLILLLSFYLWV